MLHFFLNITYIHNWTWRTPSILYYSNLPSHRSPKWNSLSVKKRERLLAVYWLTVDSRYLIFTVCRKWLLLPWSLYITNTGSYLFSALDKSITASLKISSQPYYRWQLKNLDDRCLNFALKKNL